MSSLENKKIKDTYKDLLQVSNENNGIDDTLRTVSDGEGTESSLKLSSTNASFSGNVGIGPLGASPNAGDLLHISTAGLSCGLTLHAETKQAKLVANSAGSLEVKAGNGGNAPEAKMAFTVNDVEAMRIRTDGNVGIGTDDPSHDLTLGSPTSTGTTTERLKIYRGADDSGQNLEMGFNNITVTRDANRLDDPQSTFSIKQKGSDGTRTAMHIDTAGNVGIGITSPASAFHVKSSLDGPIFDSGGTNNTNHALLVRDNSNNQLLRVDNNGKVGIGTSQPNSKLSVFSFTDVTKSQIRLTAGQNTVDMSEDLTDVLTSGDTIRFGNLNSGDTSTKEYKVDSITSDTLTLTENLKHTHDAYISKAYSTFDVESGNVGIGTSQPQSKLHIVGETPSITLQNSVDSGASYIRFVDSQGGANLQAYMGYDDALNLFKFDTNSNGFSFSQKVGIGTTSPDYELEIQDSKNDAYISVLGIPQAGILFGDTDASARGGVIYNNNNNALAFRTNDNTEKMRIDSSGNVGIGTDDPNAKLHLNLGMQGSTNTASGLLIDATSGSVDSATLDVSVRNSTDGKQFASLDVYDSEQSIGDPKSLVFQPSGGNVGIGTDNPQELLTIRPSSGNADHTAILTSLGGSNENLYYTEWTSASGFKVHRATGTGGNLTIGIDTPDGVGFQGTGGNIAFKTNSNGTYATRVIIGKTGNVGIGDSNPSKKLSVAGDAIITGDLTVSGTTITKDQETILVQDKNIILGSVASGTPNDDTANGGGIVLKGDTDKSILYDKGTESWNFNLPIKINSQTVATQSWVSDNAFSSLTDAQKAELKGDQGDQGESGADGADGADGAKGDQGDSYFTQNENGISYSDGNVGIGTSPTKPLEVAQATGSAGLRLNYLPDQYPTRYNADLYHNGFGNLIIESWADSASQAGDIILAKNGGKVGIGTESPDGKLEVHTNSDYIDEEYGNLSDSLLLKNTSDMVGAGPKLIFYNDNRPESPSSTPSALIGLQRVDNASHRGNMVFYTRGTANPVQRMIIDSDGNVGIGTTIPNAKLEVFQDLDTSNGGSILKVTNTRLNTGSSSSVISLITDEVDGNTADERVQLAGSYDGNNGGKFDILTNNGTSLSSAMTIDYLGNVGIGTTDPDAKLHIGGTRVNNIDYLAIFDSTTKAKFRIGDESNVGQNRVILSNNYKRPTGGTYLADDSSYGVTNVAFLDGEIKFATAAAGNNFPEHRMTINSAGNVGIGTTSPSDFDSEANHFVIQGNNHTGMTICAGNDQSRSNIYFADGSNGTENYSGGITYDHKDDNLSLRAGSKEAMWISSNGNVGIGTDDPSPSAKLEVDYIASTHVGLTLNGSNTALNNAIKLTDASDNEILLSIKEGDFSINGGNVGIGTITPGALLHLKQGSVGENDNRVDSIISLHTSNNTIKISHFGHNHPSAPSVNQIAALNAEQNLHLVTDSLSNVNAGTSKKGIIIKSGGNVGIGDSKPSKKLSVAGDAIIAGDLTVGGTTITTDQETLLVQNKNIFMGSIASGTPTDDTANGGGIIVKASSDKSILFNKTTNKFDVNIGATFDGNVGIGTTIPGSSLHVAGAIGTIPVGNGVHMGVRATGGNRAIMQLNAESGGYIDFSVSGTDWKGRILYDNPNNYMQFHTNTVERMRIDSDGNVGIGTKEPSARLEVHTDSDYIDEEYGNLSDSLLLKNTSDMVGAGPKLIFYNANNPGSPSSTPSALIGLQRVDNASNRGNMVFYTRGTSNPVQRMIITGSGNVGIGTPSPSGILDVVSAGLGNATQYLRNDTVTLKSVCGQSSAVIGTDTNHQLSFAAGGTIVANITPAGNVGIGTPSPDFKLTVDNGIGNYGLKVIAGNNGDSNESVIEAWNYKTNGSDPDVLFKVRGDGNVGIGTASPSGALDLYRATGTTNLNLHSNVYAANYALIAGAGGSNAIGIYDNNESAYRVLINSAGNVGIGTASPALALDILAANNNQLRIDGSDANDTTFILDYNGTGATDRVRVSNSAGDLTLSVANNNEAMRIDSSGNVGIGTDEPANLLHVKRDTTDNAYAIVENATNGNAGVNLKNANGDWNIVANANLRFIDNAVGDRMTIDQNGNVGIGTDNPMVIHHISTADSTEKYATTRYNTDNIRFDVGVGGSEVAIESLRDKFYIYDSSPIAGYQSSDRIKLVINSNGNVGIGTDDPKRKLDIDGNVRASSIDLNTDIGFSAVFTKTNKAPAIKFMGMNSGVGLNYSIGIDHIDGNNNKLHINRINDADQFVENLLTIKSNGNVGIGTDSPVGNLHVNSNSSSGTNFYLSNSFDSNVSGTWRMQADSDGTFNLGTVTSSFHKRLSISPSGNVGIGTTSPANNLVIRGSSDTGSYLSDDPPFMVIENSFNEYSKNNIFGGIGFAKTGASNVNGSFSSGIRAGIVAFYDQDYNYSGTQTAGNIGIGLNFRTSAQNAGDSQTRMTILGSGNVGIGIDAPNAKLDVKSYGSGKIVQQLQTDHTNSYSIMCLGGGGASDVKFSVDGSGQVGIGTSTTGSYKLNVQGEVYALSGVTSSDDRVKHNEQPIQNALNTLSKITPKKYIKTAKMYEANHDFALNTENKPIDEKGEEIEHTVEAGVIAQELKNINELAFVVNDEQKDEEGNVIGPHAVNYNSLFTYAIAAIQEQQTQIQSLESKVKEYETILNIVKEFPPIKGKLAKLQK